MLTSHKTQGSSAAEFTIQVADIRMGYRIFGSGYPLLLIMGYGSTMNLWESSLINKLASQFKVIIFDNRGIGSSSIGKKAFSIEQLSEDTAGLIDALGIQQAHVIGWSMGALIAQELVLRYPAKVNKLILYSAFCSGEMFPPSSEIMKQLTDMTGTPQERGMRFIGALFPDPWLQNNSKRIGEIFFHPMGNIPEETVGKQAEAIAAWKGSCDRLGEIRSPVLLITGAEDCLVVPQNSHLMSDKIRYSQLVLIENSGHGLMFQYPEIFCEQLFGFLEKI